MPFVGAGHIWLVGILLLVVLIIWGPGKLPDVGSGMGRAIREFRKASESTKAELSNATTVGTSGQPVATAVVPVSPPPVAVAPPVPAAAGAIHDAGGEGNHRTTS